MDGGESELWPEVAVDEEGLQLGDTPPPNLQPRLFVVEVGPVGARASRQGLHAQGRLRACWVPSLCHSWARRDKSGNRGAGCLLLVCGALGKPHEIPSWA